MDEYIIIEAIAFDISVPIGTNDFTYDYNDNFRIRYGCFSYI